MENAIIAALLASIACGIIGSLIVVNRLAFMAGGISHSALGGVGLAFFLRLPILPIVLIYTLMNSFILSTYTSSERENSDIVIGALWAAGMALGLILINLTVDTFLR